MKKKISFPPDINEAALDAIGYGKSISFDFVRGDLVIFHPEVFHSTPPTDLPRCSCEIRVSNTDDDHSIYRRTFANSRIFVGNKKPTKLAELQVEFLLKKYIDTNDDIYINNSPYLNYCLLKFKSLDSLSRSLCCYEDDKCYEDISADNSKICYLFLESLDIFYLPDQLLLAWARILGIRNKNKLSLLALSKIVDQSNSFYWCFECARLCFKLGHIKTALLALEKTITLSKANLLNNYKNKETPSIRENFQLKEDEVIEISEKIILDIKENAIFFKKNQDNLLDSNEKISNFDLYLYRNKGLIHPHKKNFCGFDIYSVNSFRVYYAIPTADDFFDRKKIIYGGYRSFYTASSEYDIEKNILQKFKPDYMQLLKSFFTPVKIISIIFFDIYALNGKFYLLDQYSKNKLSSDSIKFIKECNHDFGYSFNKVLQNSFKLASKIYDVEGDSTFVSQTRPS